MRTETSFPHRIVEEENVFVPLDDVTLAARIWRPADTGPVPAILEYIPYRKRFGSRARDERNHRFLAGHGYACVRLEIRGSGESDGVLTDEYLQTELDDGVKAIAWIAEQPWCDGNVGMMGISWGGFNSLQIAALQPPALKAIITVASTDDRYADDIHYMGGALLGDNLSWASVMFSYNTMPPDPELVGERWRQMWLDRLDGSGLWLETWLRHQPRDDYWRHGSVCEDLDAIRIPVFAASGWADGYSNSVFRLMEKLSVPRRGLVGPWAHVYPNFGRPGPAIDFLGEALDWWDRWLKGKRGDGDDGQPLIAAWMQDSAPPAHEYDDRPGRWVGVEAWPSRQTEPLALTLAPGRALVDGGADEVSVEVQSPVTTGLASGKWCAYGKGPDLAGDQRTDDGGSLVFQTEPLEEAVEILGAPAVELELASDQPVALVAVRLSDVRPNAEVTRVSFGILNLTQRENRARPEPLEPGRRYRVRVPMNDIGQRFPRGHRIRLAISTIYWPLAWLPPRPVRLTIWTGASRLVLPRWTGAEEAADAPSFGAARGAEPSPQTVLRAPEHRWQVFHDLGEQWSELKVTDDAGLFRFDDIDLTVGARGVERYRVRPGDVDSASGETEWVRTLSRGDWNIRTFTRTRLTSDAQSFRVVADLDAYEGEVRVRSRSWDVRIPRENL